MTRRRIALVGIVCSALIFGCASRRDDSSLHVKRLRSVDGLERVDFASAGTLELRENHGIGGYDKLLVPDASITFLLESQRLTKPARRIFLEMLRSSFVDAIEVVNLPVVDEPGQCVMEIDLAAIGFDLTTERHADQLVTLTMVMQFRDSESGDLLLRYSTEHLIANPENGATHDTKLREGLDEIVRDLNLAGSLRGAGLADDAIRPGCDGTLAQLGRRAQGGR